MDFVQHGEPGELTTSLHCGPVQCLQHAVDTRGVSISAQLNQNDCTSVNNA